MSFSGVFHTNASGQLQLIVSYAKLGNKPEVLKYKFMDSK